MKKVSLAELSKPDSLFRKTINEIWLEYLKDKEEKKEKVKKVV